MTEKRPQIWIERIAAGIPLPYPFTAIIIAAIVAGIFFFFSRVVVFFPWEFFHQMNVLSITALIALEIAGIIYILRQTDEVFTTFLPTVVSDEERRQLCEGWIRRFSHSPLYYVLVILVLAPFILSFGGFGYLAREPANVWSGLLDIYSLAVSFFFIWLLAVILWIMINVVLLLNELEKQPFRDTIRVDIFSVDGLGGLKPLQDFTIRILLLYFTCCALAIASNTGPFEFLSWDSLCFIALMATGICIFLFMIIRIRSLVRRRIEREIDKIDRVYKEQQEKLIGITSADELQEQKDTLDLIRTSLDALHTQRERMLGLYNNCTGYDVISVLKISGTFTLSIIAYVQKILEFGTSLMVK